ncbi:MAG: carboxypeptidase regulatory-like domain-containing protein [Vicinamibacterales bacterium]
MNERMRLGFAALAAVSVVALNAGRPLVEAQAGKTGVIQGLIRLEGPAPANPIIRMGADPKCGQMYKAARPTQDFVLRSADGGLANALVEIDGKFPASKAPAAPVTIDQRGCIFLPRVVAAQVGQRLEVKNDDPVGHNVHSLSTANPFNSSQPVTGMVLKVDLKHADPMLRIKCDLHSWMIAYVAVRTHPYVAVSGADGRFTVSNVPAGNHTLKVWHERFGQLTQSVVVSAGKTSSVDFSYTGKEKPSPLAFQDVVVSTDTVIARLLPLQP